MTEWSWRERGSRVWHHKRRQIYYQTSESRHEGHCVIASPLNVPYARECVRLCTHTQALKSFGNSKQLHKVSGLQLETSGSHRRIPESPSPRLSSLLPPGLVQNPSVLVFMADRALCACVCVCVGEIERPARCYDSAHGDLIRLWVVTACPSMSACEAATCRQEAGTPLHRI